MFDYALIKKNDLRRLQKSWELHNRFMNVYRWFGGWKDLDIIWEYIKKENYEGDIESCRKKYAAARLTDQWGRSYFYTKKDN